MPYGIRLWRHRGAERPSLPLPPTRAGSDTVRRPRLWSLSHLTTIRDSSEGNTSILEDLIKLMHDPDVVILLAPDGWRVVHELFAAGMDRAERYPAPESAFDALRAYIDVKTKC